MKQVLMEMKWGIEYDEMDVWICTEWKEENVYLREILGLETVSLAVINRNRLRWFGHVDEWINEHLMAGLV